MAIVSMTSTTLSINSSRQNLTAALAAFNSTRSFDYLLAKLLKGRKATATTR